MLYQRHIRYYLTHHTLFVVIASIAIAWFQQLLKFGYLLNRGVSILDLLYLSALTMPKLLFVSLPIIVPLGVLIAYYDLMEGRVLVIYRAAGLSNIGLAYPALKFALISSFILYSISGYLLPVSHNVLRAKLQYFRDNFFFSIVDEKTFTTISNSVILYIGAKNGHAIDNVIIFDDRDEANKSIIIADKGQFEMVNAVPHFSLYKGTRITVPVLGENTNKSHNSGVLSFNELEINFATNHKKQAAEYKKEIEEYAIEELLWPIGNFSPKEHLKLRLEGYKRLIWPLYSFVMTATLLAVFLNLRDSRSGIKISQWGAVALAILVPCYGYFASLNIVLKTSQYFAVIWMLPAIWFALALKFLISVRN